MDCVQLSGQSSEDVLFDATKCIICQKDTSGKTISTKNGCKRIYESSEVRNDYVSKRLKLVEEDTFVYHMTNICYKSYTMKTDLDRLQKKTSTECQDPSVSEENARENRSSRCETVRYPPKTELTVTELYNVNCIICDSKSHKKEYTKYRICESGRASSFLAAASFFQDAVFTRTCDLQDTYAVFGADLFYHRDCMTKYLYKYETHDKASQPKASEKKLAWNHVTKELEEGLKNGKGYELSVIRDLLNSINENCNFRNRDVKIFLLNHFGGQIDFTDPGAGKKSLMAFSVPSSTLAGKLRSVDPVQACASIVRKALEDYDFDLDDRFCDAEDLKQASSNMGIPDSVLSFFGHLYNFKPTTYTKAAEAVMAEDSATNDITVNTDCDHDDDDDYVDNEAVQDYQMVNSQ
eukprot:GHVU01236350.1.p1 GENE.GHVU01236350.1~~GHVU01236350.1.p1  ORF type:complete len:407 (-),score=39.87 GHVU01236350.1:38-1258(-)